MIYGNQTEELRRELDKLKRQIKRDKADKLTINKFLTARAKQPKDILKPNKTTVIISSEADFTDRSRFFNDNFQEDRRQLFFA